MRTQQIQQTVARLTLAAVAMLTLTLHARTQAKPWTHPDGTTHWYEVVYDAAGVTWDEASNAAAGAGGYLATITTKQENEFLMTMLQQDALKRGELGAGGGGPWLGGRQPSGATEPAGKWGWSELEPFSYSNWAKGQPDNNAGADAIHLIDASGSDGTWMWGDAPSGLRMPGYVVEFSGPHAKRTIGVTRRQAGASNGYTLIGPNLSRNIYLIDSHGRVVHAWGSAYTPGQSVYLLPNGNLLRCGKIANTNAPGLGNGGIIEEFDWDGKPVWSYVYDGSTFMQHHDIHRMPNGNTLMIAWIKKSKDDAIAAGRDSKLIPDGDVWPDKIIEVQKTGPTTGKIVWEWSAWDHLVQDHDKTKANFGEPAKHPELIDVNYAAGLGAGGGRDWMHANAIFYNAKLDQIMLSVRNFSEFWVIDHSTTTQEAAGHTGGTSGKGGDLLYRWGNPQTYRAGSEKDRQLFTQHDAHWIADGLPGAGNILIFNNGENGFREYSTVVEITPPTVDAKGNYPRTAAAFGPVKPTWSYTAPNPRDFYSQIISGVQRLPSGNTLICGGWIARTFEVTKAGATVWDYTCPIGPVAYTQGDLVASPLNTHFRAPHYLPNYAAFTGRTLTPGEPLEKQAAGLLANGSGAPIQIKPGASVSLSLRAAHLPNQPYVVISAVNNQLTPIDNRWIGLGWDPLVQMSLQGTLPTVFIGYQGTLDAQGGAKATLAIPSNTPLVGQTIQTVLLVLGPAPSGVSMISNTVGTDIVK